MPESRDSSESAHLVALGPPLITRMLSLLRGSRLYDITNQALQRQVQEFMTTITRGLADEGEVSLVAVAGYFYLNGVRLKAHPALYSAYHSLMAEFDRRGMGGVRFLNGVTAPEIERFFQLVAGADDPGLSGRLGEALQEASVANILLIPAQDLDAEDIAQEGDQEVTNERGRARKVFWRAVLGTKKIVLRAVQTGRPDLRQAKRLVQPVVDSIMKNEYSIVGLTALKDHDEYTYAHCVNVSVLSVSMGQALGLSRQALADLGVAALLHDVGKIAVPPDVLRKPGALDSREWAAVQRHPLEGVKMMTRMAGLSSLTLDTMRVCLEHHMNFDRTGYPDVDAEWRQATMSRIVAVADCFDAITAHRAYHTRAFSPFEGLQHMMGMARVRFDPAVLWALVRTVGLYPAGSVLLTNSNHVVLSLSPNPEDLQRPHARVLVRPDGTEPAEDLPETWDPMPAGESVQRVLSPEERAVSTNELLAA